tara:strand:+ start:125 stop:412 length:288 start_codon:yes stop_codon:yes gene_type:complete
MDIDKLKEWMLSIENRITELEKKGIDTGYVNNNTKPKLLPKTKIDWESLKQATMNTKAYNFVENIHRNSYPSITEGQYNALAKIADTYHCKINNI